MTASAPLRVAVMGIGKIARDQHLPVIAGRRDVELVATVSRSARLDRVPAFQSLDEAFAQHPAIEAVVLCTPPVGRHAQAKAALAAGRHVFLEKPPAATLAEVDDLRAHAERKGRTLFASWHSRCAAGVEPARRWLANKRVHRVHIAWKEDVRKWHPGQDWIFAGGGMGVFDPAINALSIATRILPLPFALAEASLDVPANRQAPVRASLRFADAENARITADLDFLHADGECWDIDVETDGGSLKLSRGGAMLAIDGHDQGLPSTSEYAGLYDRFVELVRSRQSEVDTTPFVHVADAFMLGERRIAEPFAW
jgi:D-galactose 1-dehydrogenase